MDTAPTSHSANLTILLIDDERINLRIFSRALSKQYQVLVADSGPQALALANAEPKPDLILLDVMMPVMNGYQVIELLKANPQTRDIPVVFMSALSSEQEKALGLALGAADYIAKPCYLAEVISVVEQQLHKKSDSKPT